MDNNSHLEWCIINRDNHVHLTYIYESVKLFEEFENEAWVLRNYRIVYRLLLVYREAQISILEVVRYIYNEDLEILNSEGDAHILLSCSWSV